MNRDLAQSIALKIHPVSNAQNTLYDPKYVDTPCYAQMFSRMIKFLAD